MNEKLGNVHLPLVDDSPVLLKHELIADVCNRYLNDGDSFLDAGCGLGQVSMLVQKKNKNAEIHLADAYKECIDLSISRVSAAATYLIDEQSFDLSSVPNEYFDVVVLSHVLEHLLNPVDAMRQLVAKLKPNGILVVAVPNAIRPDLFLLSAMRRHYVNRGHVFAWDRSTWRNFLERILQLEVVEYADSFLRFPGHSRPVLRPLSLALGKMFPHWCNEHIAVIRNSDRFPDSGRRG